MQHFFCVYSDEFILLDNEEILAD